MVVPSLACCCSHFQAGVGVHQVTHPLAMKRPASREKNNSVRQRLQKTVSKAEVAQCIRDTVGKRRTCYALYIEEQYPLISQELTDEGFAREDGRIQRTIMHRISARWAGLSERQKDKYRTAAKEEFAAQQSALSAVLHEAPAESEVLLADAPSAVGNWTFLNPDEPLWTGGKCKGYLVQHKLLRYRMMATVFEDVQDFDQELRVLNELNKQESADFNHEVFLVAMESTVLTAPVRCLVQQWLPMLDEISEPMRGSKLAAVACQLAQALIHLHGLGVLHLDVRGKTVFWSERECLAKLGRFHRARAMDSQEPLLYPPYAATHRPPECFLCPLDKTPSIQRQSHGHLL